MPEAWIQDKAKESAGEAAANLIQNGMLVGLGTGSTANFFIKHLVRRYHEGLKIQIVATSQLSHKLAEEGGIPLLDINELTELDLVVDGADEIDRKKRMIKGGGGALLREKIVATMAKEMVVIVDETKCVELLGAVPLPIEIAPFAYKATLKKFVQLGFTPKIRTTFKEHIYITANGNYIADLHFPFLLESPEVIDQMLLSIPGVIETGLFLNLAGRVILGHRDGTVTILT
jgi:ribose 5-phosphate isomerase A